jgi:hypothetical protein
MAFGRLHTANHILLEREGASVRNHSERGRVRSGHADQGHSPTICTMCRSAATFARQASLPRAAAKQTFPAAASIFSVKARWASVGPAASAKKVSDEMLKKLGSLSTQVRMQTVVWHGRA